MTSRASRAAIRDHSLTATEAEPSAAQTSPAMEDAETAASIEYLRNVVNQARPRGMTLSNDVRRLLAAYDRLQRERLEMDGLLPSGNPTRDAIWDDGYEAGSRDHANRRDEALAEVRRELWWVGTCQPEQCAWTAVLTLDWPEFEALRRVAGLKPYRTAPAQQAEASPQPTGDCTGGRTGGPVGPGTNQTPPPNLEGK
jgi:hypothetical protein